jgi:hypothetical protein
VAVQIERDGERQTLTARLSAAKEEGLKEGEEDSEAPEAGESKHSQETPDSDFDYDFDNDFDVDGGSVEIPGRGFTMIGGGRGRLGVRIETLNPGLGDYFGVKDGKGVLVVEVLKDTPAERAGMKAGDVIVRLDDRDVNDSDDLVRAIRSSKDGKVTIDVVRHSAPRTLEAQLRAAPQAPRVMRLRRPGEGGVRTWSWSGAPDRDDLRRELLDLREELREMKKELEELRKR